MFAQDLPFGIGLASSVTSKPEASLPIFSTPLPLDVEEEKRVSELETSTTLQEASLVAALAPETDESTLHRSMTVQDGDSLSSVAARYKLSEDTLRQINGIYRGANVHKDQTLQIPPRDGILVTMSEGQSIDDLAKTYNVARERILYFNEYLEEPSRSLRGAEVFIPDVNPANYVKSAPVRRYTSVRYSFSPPSPPGDPSSSKETTAGFYRGYCTEWAANRTKELGGEPVTWRGNGGAWARNAAVQGRTVNKVPEVGAIVSTTEGYATGHVAVIEQVHEDGSMTISEKNYAGWNQVSTRTIRPDDPQVLGIIH